MVVINGLAITAGSKFTFFSKHGQSTSHELCNENRHDQRDADDSGYLDTDLVNDHELGKINQSQRDPAQNGNTDLFPHYTKYIRKVQFVQGQPPYDGDRCLAP